MDTHELSKLAQMRQVLSDTQAAVKKQQQALELTPTYTELMRLKSMLVRHSADVDSQERLVKVMALSEYKKTKTEPTQRGLIFKMFHTLKYDLTAAESWAKENAKVLFKFDVKEFEKMASKIEIPGVTKTDKPTIQLASDLSEYL